jgi:hypothetical protein
MTEVFLKKKEIINPLNILDTYLSFKNPAATDKFSSVIIIT